jgi:eukaryotic-like serine/threonine-protein kinase
VRSVSTRDRFGLVGHTIANTFRVDQVVAEGGFGIVYRAFHLHFRSPVALKCLKIPEELSESNRTQFLEQFRSEAEVLFHLSTVMPNIVRPLHVDAVMSPRGHFVPLMALEWLEGTTIDKIIEERTLSGQAPLRLDEACELLDKVATTLEEAHNFQGHHGPLSIVHRDIKPDNLFVCSNRPMVKILDFGISKVHRTAQDLAGQGHKTDGTAPFSPAYGAPEQWVPKRYGQTGPWTDVWGLALTLVEVIKGDVVIIGDHQQMMGTALDPLRRPTPLNEGVEVAPEVNLVFDKALAVDPRFRYQSIRAFWDALALARHVGGSHSERKIKLRAPPDLPAMLPPTPFTPPRRFDDERRFTLPPLAGPAELRETSVAEQALGPSRPFDPLSGLAPLPAAPVHHDLEDVSIPPLDSRPNWWTSMDTPEAPEAATGVLEIELAATSVFPPAPHTQPSPTQTLQDSPGPAKTDRGGSPSDRPPVPLVRGRRRSLLG